MKERCKKDHRVGAYIKFKLLMLYLHIAITKSISNQFQRLNDGFSENNSIDVYLRRQNEPKSEGYTKYSSEDWYFVFVPVQKWE